MVRVLSQRPRGTIDGWKAPQSVVSIFLPSKPSYTPIHTWWLSSRESVLRLALATVLPNVPLLLIRWVLHMKSGFLNPDYFFLTLIACAFNPVLASALFILAYIFELIRLLDSLFYFSQRDPLFAFRFLGQLERTLVLGWAAAFVLVCGLSLWLWNAAMPRLKGKNLLAAAIPVGVILLVLGSVDQALGFRFSGNNRHLRPGNRAVDEVLLRIPLSIARPAPAATAVPIDGSASEPLWNDPEIAQQHENVLLVLVESMGRIVDAGGDAREFALFSDLDLQRRYSVSRGTVPFSGPTVSGEMRELCHLRTGMYITARTLEGQQPCLPARFREQGYEALAVHGYRATMFQRSDWYPRLGFTGRLFLGDLLQLPACDGAFYGTCDDAIAGFLRGRLELHAAGQSPPQFLYWLTLNSHLPVDKKHAPKEVCPVAASADVCAHLAYVQSVLASVKTIALDPRIGRTVIVLVGDHAPPFLVPKDRGQFDGKNVPYLVLKPR